MPSRLPRTPILNETYARRNWPNADPVGKSVWLGCDPNRPRKLAQVVGIAKDARYESLDEAPRSYAYRPLAQNWVGFGAVIVQTSGNPNDLDIGKFMLSNELQDERPEIES